MRRVQSARNPRVWWPLIALVLTLVWHPAVSAQKSRPLPSPPPRPSEGPPPPTESSTRNVRTFEQANFELQVLLATRSRELDLERERRRLANQLARDIQRLEEIEMRQISPLTSARTIDYKRLAAATGELSDRAARIKYAVPLQLKGNKPERVRYEAHADKLGTMLPDLSRALTSFLQNPVFRLASPNDAELRLKARRDLENIIGLSKTINKIAKQLSKTHAPPE